MIEHADVSDLKAAIDGGEATVIDVRESYEYQSGHVPGAVHMPMHTIALRSGEIQAGGRVYVICESGSRSWQVAAFLQQRGIHVINVNGGTGNWRMSGLPVETAVTA